MQNGMEWPLLLKYNAIRLIRANLCGTPTPRTNCGRVAFTPGSTLCLSSFLFIFSSPHLNVSLLRTQALNDALLCPQGPEQHLAQRR